MTKRNDADILVREVVLEGMTDIMFDRYPGDNTTTLEPQEKAYYDADGRTLVFPAENVMSFLSAENTMSAPKRLLPAKEYKRVAQACKSWVHVTPMRIPFTRGGKPVVVGEIADGRDPKSGLYVHRNVARLDKGVPNPKARPTLPLPWEMSFKVNIYRNDEINEERVRRLFERGGAALGFGTFRGVYGKFRVVKWE